MPIINEKWKLNEDQIDQFRHIFDCELGQKLEKAGNWNQVCAAMDSIQVGVVIINKISWDEKDDRFALQLIELFTAGQMIKEGVFRMSKALFNNDYELKDDNSILKHSISDDKAFGEYRALSFAHSVEFRASNEMANGQKSYFSWLIWDLDSGAEKIANAFRYPDNTQIKINFNDVFNYVQKRYEYLDTIKEKIITKFNV